MAENFQIYLDSIVFSIQRFGGASTYWKELLIKMMSVNDVNIIFQTSNPENLNDDGREVWNCNSDRQVDIIIEDRLPASILRYLPLTKILPPKSLYHNSYYRTCLQKNVANIFTVHDFTHKRGLASKFPRKLIHIGLTKLGLKNADGIICISQSTKKDLLYFYPQINEDKVTVIYHGVSDIFFPLPKPLPLPLFYQKVSWPNKFVLFVGKRGGYKKFDIIPKALITRSDLQLVIVGGGELSALEVANLEETLPGRYIHLNFVDNKELNILYNNAHCLLYTSIYEGFGIPLLEAMKAGCPIITNRLSSLGEIADDAALFIDEITSAAVERKIKEMDNIDLRRQLIAKGIIRSAQFTWERCFRETYSFYNKIYRNKFN